MICQQCNKRKCKTQRRKDGSIYHYPKCRQCSQSLETFRAQQKRRRERLKSAHPYRSHKKDYCENPECTATIVDSCQLDVDHIDGDHTNNDSKNLMTLCANCHRLKTKLAKNHRKPIDLLPSVV